MLLKHYTYTYLSFRPAKNSTAKKSPTKEHIPGTGSHKIKSAEFVQSDEDASSDDKELSESDDAKGLK